MKAERRPLLSPLTVALQTGAGLFAQDGAKDDGHHETEEENAGDHQPLVLLEEHVELNPGRERAYVVDVVADPVGSEARTV